MNGDLGSVIFSSGLSLLLFLFFFGASVFFHELGHFLAARKRGLVVEKFSVGFPPIVWKKRVNDVDYCIGAIPFGGFVSLPQLAGARVIEGESNAKALPEISWLDKVIVAAAGPAFSMLFAFILGLVLWVTGLPVSERMNTTVIGYISDTIEVGDQKLPSPAREAGLKLGDRIISIDGRAVANFEDITYGVILGGTSSPDGKPSSVFSIERDGQKLDVVVRPILYKQGVDEVRKVGIGPADTVLVGAVQKSSPADAAGLQAGDRIRTWNGEKLWSSSQWLKQQDALPSKEPPAVTLGIERSGKSLSFNVVPRLATVDTAGRKEIFLGVMLSPSLTTSHLPPWTLIGNSLDRSFQTLRALLSPGSNIGLDKMNGPVGIAHVVYYYSQADLRLVIGLILFLNVSLALLNMLPLPVLDGGHITVAILSRLRGKQLPESFMAYTQSVFVVMLLGLMLYVMFNDSRRVLHDVNSAREAPAMLPEPVFEPLPAK